MVKVDEVSAMLLGLVSGFLLGLWFHSKLVWLLSWLERRLSGYERKEKAEAEPSGFSGQGNSHSA